MRTQYHSLNGRHRQAVVHTLTSAQRLLMEAKDLEAKGRFILKAGFGPRYVQQVDEYYASVDRALWKAHENNKANTMLPVYLRGDHHA